MNCVDSLNEKGQHYHIAAQKEISVNTCCCPAIRSRTDLIAQRFDNPVLIAHNREHKTWTGTLDGVPVSVTSTGMVVPPQRLRWRS